ncbi:MAG: N-glycosylase/DNA lyase [Nanoarchaeota archaeon]|nr:N-glycosylase/DNA lyase [Nanoarchaeota archaeon]MBU1974784.1 N-glycosylase/DNA lyase [Nanoarchaeota archaeon]
MVLDEVINLKKTSIKKQVDTRLKQFKSFQSKPSKEWFSELCFCILTANSKALTAINIQNELGAVGFCDLSEKDLVNTIQKNKHRFHNNKAKYIVEARCHVDIKKKIANQIKEGGKGSGGEMFAREWLVKNIKGIGYKESSHFLRNVGYQNLAILDRHIINLMLDHKLIKDKPKALTKKNYLEIEKKFSKLAQSIKMNCAELDLYMWYIKTGKVLK